MTMLDKLNPREKSYVIVGLLVLLLSGYYRLVYQPFTKEIAYQKKKIFKSETQLAELSAKYPPVEIQKERIKKLTDDNDRILKQIAVIEKQLPNSQDASRLIGEFTRLASATKLISIRQKIVSKDGYNRIFVEIKMNAPYASAINYISRIESISPYIRIDEVAIDETKGKRVEEGGPPVRVVVSWILGDAPTDQLLKAKENDKVIQVDRDILVSKAKPAAALEEKDIKLEGITFNPQNSTAIINGEVFRVGATIKGMTVKEIKKDGVTLTDGVQDHFVKLA